MGERPEEDVELDPELRRYVDEMHGRLKSVNHYEVLAIPRTADKKAVKRAYFQLVTVIHPDRYFQKKLGTYKAKLEAIFARVTTAHETLVSPDSRAAYDARLGAAPQAVALPSAPRPVDPVAAAKKQEALDALKQRYLEAKSRAKTRADAGARARASGDLVTAMAEYKAAIALAPQDPAIRAALAEVERVTAERMSETHASQAALEERYGHWAEAAESWKRVLAARPHDQHARERLANALAKIAQRG